MVHTFPEIRNRAPANPNEAALEAAMPQMAWEALLWDEVQGLCCPYTPETLRWWLQTTHSQVWAMGAPQACPTPHHHHNGKEMGKDKRGAREGQGYPGRGVRRGPR